MGQIGTVTWMRDQSDDQVDVQLALSKKNVPNLKLSVWLRFSTKCYT